MDCGHGHENDHYFELHLKLKNKRNTTPLTNDNHHKSITKHLIRTLSSTNPIYIYNKKLNPPLSSLSNIVPHSFTFGYQATTQKIQVYIYMLLKEQQIPNC